MMLFEAKDADDLGKMWTRRLLFIFAASCHCPATSSSSSPSTTRLSTSNAAPPFPQLRASSILRNSRGRPLTDSSDAQVRPPYRSWHERMGAMHSRPQCCLSSPCSASMQCRAWTSRSMYHPVSLLFRHVSILRFVSSPRGLPVGSSTVCSGALLAIARLRTMQFSVDYDSPAFPGMLTAFSDR